MFLVIYHSISLNLCGRDQDTYYLGLLHGQYRLNFFACIILSVFKLFILKTFGRSKMFLTDSQPG